MASIVAGIVVRRSELRQRVLRRGLILVATLAAAGGIETIGLGSGQGSQGRWGGWGQWGVASAQCSYWFGARLEGESVPNASTSVSADFDQDGFPDIAVRTTFNAPEAGVYMLWGLGEGRFEPAQQIWAGPTAALAMGDLRGDGLPDLVVSSNGPVQIFTLANAGPREFAVMPGVSFTPPSVCVDLAVGDVNGDGFDDVIGLDRNNDRVGVFVGDGGGRLSAPVSTTITMTSASAMDTLAAGDLNGDGRADCVVVDRFTNGGQTRLHTLVAGAGPLILTGTHTLAQVAPGPVGLGDVDGDRHLDAVISVAGAQQAAAVFRGLGNGTIAAPDFFPGIATVHGRPVIRDLDLDGDTDVAMGNNVIRVWLNDGSGRLAPQPGLAGNVGGFGVHAGPFMSTDRPDLVIVGGGASSPRLAVFPSVPVPSVVEAIQAVVPGCPGATVFPEVRATPDTDARYEWQIRRGRLGYEAMIEGEPLFTDSNEDIAFARNVTEPRLALTFANRCCLVDLSFTIRCVVTTACGTTAGPDILITLCRIDMTCDGFVDFFDYDQFVQDYTDGGEAADFNRDGFLDFFDYDDFVAAFEIGC
jgi:hypothetical protein